MYISYTYISLVVHFGHGFFLFVGSTLFAGITYTAYWLSVCDPSLLHQIAAQAYVCNLIQPCSTNLYTYACLLPHVLVFIPWGIHMHGSIAAQAVFPAWWYHLLSVWGVCCACPTPTVYAWGPLNTTELLSFPYACILPFSLFVEAPNQFWFYCFMLYPYPCIRSNVCLRYLYMVCF